MLTRAPEVSPSADGSRLNDQPTSPGLLAGEAAVSVNAELMASTAVLLRVMLPPPEATALIVGVLSEPVSRLLASGSETVTVPVAVMGALVALSAVTAVAWI